MDAEELVYGILSSDPNVTSSGAQAFPGVAPLGFSGDCIVITRSTTRPVENISHTGQAGVDFATIRCACYSSNYRAANQLTKLVRAAIINASVKARFSGKFYTYDEATRDHGMILELIVSERLI